MFFGGLVGAETCCQTVQKVGEVPGDIIRPEIVEAVCRGPGRVVEWLRRQPYDEVGKVRVGSIPGDSFLRE